MMKMEDETVLTTSAKVARLPCPDAATKKFVEAQRKLFAVGELAQWKIDWLERIPGWSWCDPNDVGKTQTPKWSTYKRKSKAVCETTLPFLEEIRANPDFGGFRDLAETAEKTIRELHGCLSLLACFEARGLRSNADNDFEDVDDHLDR